MADKDTEKNQDKENEKPSKPNPSEKKDKDKKKTEGVFLPVLVEFFFSFSAILLVLLFLTIITISLITGTKLLDIVIRTSVALLTVGLLLVLISRQIVSGMSIEDNFEEQKGLNHKKREEPERLIESHSSAPEVM